jgi:hypothetical protein
MAIESTTKKLTLAKVLILHTYKSFSKIYRKNTEFYVYVVFETP